MLEKFSWSDVTKITLYSSNITLYNYIFFCHWHKALPNSAQEPESTIVTVNHGSGGPLNYFCN